MRVVPVVGTESAVRRWLAAICSRRVASVTPRARRCDVSTDVHNWVGSAFDEGGGMRFGRTRVITPAPLSKIGDDCGRVPASPIFFPPGKWDCRSDGGNLHQPSSPGAAPKADRCARITRAAASRPPSPDGRCVPTLTPGRRRPSASDRRPAGATERPGRWFQLHRTAEQRGGLIHGTDGLDDRWISSILGHPQGK